MALSQRLPPIPFEILVAIALLILLAGSADGQQPGTGSSFGLPSGAEIGREHPGPLHRIAASTPGVALKEIPESLRDKVAVLQAGLQTAPSDAKTLTSLAETLVTAGLLSSSGEAAVRRYEEAESMARLAVALAPESPDARYWLGAALGMRADHEPHRSAVRLADEVHAEAQRVLELDPDHAGGHHLMARLNASIMKVGAFRRFIGRLLLGSDALDGASWKEAESCFRKAMRAEPDNAIHTLELAKIYLDRDREEEARSLLGMVVKAPVRGPLDGYLRAEATALLNDLG